MGSHGVPSNTAGELYFAAFVFNLNLNHGVISPSLLYLILRDTLDLRTYALDDKSWVESLQVCSFVFNTALVDDRHSTERLTNPRVLDVGMAEATLPDVNPRSSIHIRGSWNAYLSRGKQGVS